MTPPRPIASLLAAACALALCAAGAHADPAGAAKAPAKPAAVVKPAERRAPVHTPAIVSLPPMITTEPGFDQLQTHAVSYAERRFIGVVRQSFDLSCGAAALATLLQGYFGLPADEQTVITGMLQGVSPEDAQKIGEDGFSMLELKHYAESRGLIAGGFKTGDAAELRKLKAPVIALINTRGYNHFVVIRHVRGNEVSIADPVFGNRVEDLTAFAGHWNKVILVAVAPGKKTNVAFMETPGGTHNYDARAAQLYLTRSYPQGGTYVAGDFY
ncbi:MAG: C39 family peptidase [Caulobacterales bacterium]